MTAEHNATELVDLLERMSRLHTQMLSLVRAKLVAMQRADIGAMDGLGREQSHLVGEIGRLEADRRKLVTAITAALTDAKGGPTTAQRQWTVSQLAARLPEPQRRALLAAGEKLRETHARLSAASRVSAAVAREVVHHLHWVFAAIVASGKPETYASDEFAASDADGRLLETLG